MTHRNREGLGPAPTDSVLDAAPLPSIGSGGDCDNALMESLNGLYRAECIRTTVFHDRLYKTIADVEYATAGSCSTLGNVSPVEHEQAHSAALNREPRPV